MQIEMRVLELLSSKLCHDLISPVSAINNGVELIEEIGEPVVEEAMKLIGDSANLASRRLKYFRLAYGRAGSEASLGPSDVKPVIESYFAGGKITLDWPADLAIGNFVEQQGFLKTLMNLFLLAEEVLAYGGTLTLGLHEEGTNHGLKLSVAGRGAQLSEMIGAALDGTTPVDDLTPRSVQAYMTGRFVAHFGLVLRHLSPSPEQLDFVLMNQPVEYDEASPE